MGCWGALLGCCFFCATVAQAAQPYSDEELQHRKKVFLELNEAAAYAEQNSGMCDDLDYISNAASGYLKLAPERCPAAARIDELYRAGEAKLRKLCRDHMSWVEASIAEG